MTIHLIPLDHLLRSKRNARKTKTGGVDDLAASILADGLLQKLLVLPIDPLPDDGDFSAGRGRSEVLSRTGDMRRGGI